ncbi:HTH domain-containing protein [Methanococcoides orientis]|uniref:helix-turn-helix domain-containing protein n=1 Tax=Methanococcoides orientis TaxID=2822137 RepID=UPI001E2B281A|nr:helix-turn-helix domain-containing protein [Methanococcoides orientis]UGV40676.1 HTH domain-containing protein [Methanococcoides orientis]
MTASIREMLRANCECDDVAKCILGLKALDMDAYKCLLANGPMTAESLGEHLNRERSTAYRSLQNLISCGLVYRETKTIDIGGYFYEYVAVDPTRVKEMLKENIDQWYEKVSGLVENIDKELLGTN